MNKLERTVITWHTVVFLMVVCLPPRNCGRIS